MYCWCYDLTAVKEETASRTSIDFRCLPLPDRSCEILDIGVLPVVFTGSKPKTPIRNLMRWHTLSKALAKQHFDIIIQSSEPLKCEKVASAADCATNQGPALQIRAVFCSMFGFAGPYCTAWSITNHRQQSEHCLPTASLHVDREENQG